MVSRFSAVLRILGGPIHTGGHPGHGSADAQPAEDDDIAHKIGSLYPPAGIKPGVLVNETAAGICPPCPVFPGALGQRRAYDIFDFVQLGRPDNIFQSCQVFPQWFIF